MTKNDFKNLIKRSIKIAKTAVSILPEGVSEFKFRVVSCKFNGGGQNDFYFYPGERKIVAVGHNAKEAYSLAINGEDFYQDATDTLAGWLNDTQCIVKKFVWLGE